MSTQLGEAFIPIRATLDKLDGDLASARSKVEGALSGIVSGVGEAIKTIGKVALVGIGAVSAVITTAVAGTLNWAEKLDAIGDVLGTTTEQSAALAVAVQHIGGNTEQLTSQVAFMTRGLVDAKGELGPTGTALDNLGISFRDANGQMLPATDILQAVADKIGAMPDGLEKTQLMMDIFGKSGKDMSDLMGALAEGGMEAFNQKAKDMGLSMSEDAVSGAIELNRSFKDLKMMGQGLLVTLGTALLPIIKPLVAGFSELAMKGIEFLRGKITEIMPVIQSVLGDLQAWLSENLPKAIQVLSDFWTGVLQPAIAEVWGWLSSVLVPFLVNEVYPWLQEFIPAALQTLADFWTNVLQPAIAAVWGWLSSVLMPFIVNTVVPWLKEFIPAALQTLADFWTNVLLPAITAVWSWLSTVLIPFIVGTVVPWLKEFIPAALQVLSDFWTTVLLPAITAVWSWLSTVLMPFIVGTVVPWLQEFIPKALQTLSDFWTNVLWPAIEGVWGFIKDNLIPIFLVVVGWLATNIPKAISTAVGFWRNVLQPALSFVWYFISTQLWPVFEDVGEWLLTTIGTAINAAAGFWKDTLKPALSTVWKFIKEDLWPIFLDVGTWLGETIGKVINTAAGFWKDTLKPAIEGVWKFLKDDVFPLFQDVGNYLSGTLGGILDAIAKGWDGITAAVNWLVGAIEDVVEWIEKAVAAMPDWLLPGSPTPFEVGLRGITDQLNQLNQVADNMPLFNGLGATLPAMAMAGAEASQYNSPPPSYSATTTIYTNRDPLRVLHASRHLDKLGRMN